MNILKQSSVMTKKYYSMLLGGTLSVMVFSVMLMSDTLIAGFSIGEDAVAGITLVTPLYSVAAFFGTILTLGVPILYSSEMGDFQKKKAERVFHSGLLMAVVTGVLLFLIVSLFGESFLKISRPSAQVLKAAIDYLAFIRFTILLLPLQTLLAESVFADGDETVSTAANLIQAIGNVVSSVILSRIMGVRGIALASFLFTCVSFLILSIHFFRKSNTLSIGFAFSFDILKKVVRYSAIDAGSFLFTGILVAVLNTFVGLRFGSGALVLVSLISLGRELQLVFDGIGEAVTPILSIYLSEDCTAGVSRIYRLARRTAIIEGLAVSVIFCIAAPFVPSFLQISDPSLADLSIAGLRIISAGSVFVSVLYLTSSYDLLIDQIPLGLLTGALRDVLIPAPMAVLFGYFFGPYGLFAAIAAAPALTVLILRLYLQRKHPGDVPLLLGSRRLLPSFLYDFTLNEDQIIKTRDTIEQELLRNNCDRLTTNNVMLLFEEVCMLLREKNTSTQIEAECSLLILDDRIRLIIRDTGITFDLTDADMEVFSLRSYVISCMTTRITLHSKHLRAMSFNRNLFEIERK